MCINHAKWAGSKGAVRPVLRHGQPVRRHFLHLSERPFPLDPTEARRIASGEDPPPLDACDVCAARPAASPLPAGLPVMPMNVGAALDAARADVEDERLSRAQTLFSLFMGPANGADALLWARMAEGREQARALAGGS